MFSLECGRTVKAEPCGAQAFYEQLPPCELVPSLCGRRVINWTSNTKSQETWVNDMPASRLVETDVLWCGITIIVAVVSGIGQMTMRYGGRGESVRSLLSLQALTEHRTWLLGLVVCWLCGLAWAVVVTRISLAVALPVFFGALYITVAIAGYLFLQDGFQLKYAVGCVLILVGIVAVVWG
jgi:multidrug transporter EmrE-like cation transporter